MADATVEAAAAAGENGQRAPFNADAFLFLPEVQMLVEAMTNSTSTTNTRDVTNAATALKNKFERAVKELDSMPSVDTTLDQQQHAYEEKLRQLNRRRELIAKYQKLAVFAKATSASAAKGESAPPTAMETDTQPSATT